MGWFSNVIWCWINELLSTKVSKLSRIEITRLNRRDPAGLPKIVPIPRRDPISDLLTRTSMPLSTAPPNWIVFCKFSGKKHDFWYTEYCGLYSFWIYLIEYELPVDESSILPLSMRYGKQNPVSPFSTSSLNCAKQSRNATIAASNLVSQKNLKPPVPYSGSSFPIPSTSMYEWLPNGTRR